ncbi:hypothetical protein QBA57_10115 [Streptomyces scabiei]|uniref:hypothetical protein n=1 Tax=Streptomyces scabiei TaxID=1930 RepID=UPI001FF07F7F|nr:MULTISPECIES: hypothetical protein [Streptomyces]MDW8476202.1 hypothetical protein [Streptomyces scabiei]MDX2539727.1 hypothetical protein [Streptomyces scabiei]MDX2570283.1 hypothetical protein [Streptomyces scabiei]MDX2628969.1 hypothetical protein [Streptomyces scabiei]MDX2690673.1 hypothetical protein [Streptomyces scabiei]
MSFSLPARALSGPRRRSLLVGAAGAGLLAGCSSGGGGADVAGSGPSAVERARARAARDSEALAERYDAVAAAHPALAGLLTPLRAEVVRHAEAFGGGKAARAGKKRGASSSSASPSVSPSGSPSASASPSPVPDSPEAALTELAAAERRLADRRAKALLEVPGEVARLMASVAAAGAGHAYMLAEGAK